MAERYPTYYAGQRLTAALLTSAQPTVARKTSDTSRSADTTPTDDPELTFEVEANAVYIWDAFIKYEAPVGGDINFDWTVPASALGEWTGFGQGRNLISTSGAPGTLSADTVTTNGYLVRMESSDVSQQRSYGGITGTPMVVIANGTLRTAGTAGTFAMAWAQAVSDVTATIVYADSWIRLQRIA